MGNAIGINHSSEGDNAVMRRIVRESEKCANEFVRRRDPSMLKSVFDKRKTVIVDGCRNDHKREIILKENLRLMMDELLLPYDSLMSDDDLLRSFDANGDGELDIEDVKIALQRPNKVDQFVASIPLGPLVASALMPIIRKKSSNEKDPLRIISTCSEKELNHVLQGIRRPLLTLMLTYVNQLKESYNKMDELKAVVNSQHDEVPTLSCGSVSAFYNGLGDRVGNPNPKFYEAMAQEHESTTQFTADNYGITTSPAEEWATVITCDKSKELRHRKVPDYRALLELELARHAERAEQAAPRADGADGSQAAAALLTDVEIIAIVLYTGPMFQIYNTVLRRFPDAKYRELLAGGALYPTTIHCLVSGVTKVSRATRIPDGLLLYRGLGGIRLPPHFDRGGAAPPGGGGHRGFVEWGFMSTTSNRAIAVQYTGLARGRAHPTLLCIRPAAVDHGADVGRFSQYPGEREYLWNPGSLIEPLGEAVVEATPDGPVAVVPVRVNMNLRTLTVEELRGQKKAAHLASFRFQHEDLRRALAGLAREAERAGRWDPCRFRGPSPADLASRIAAQHLAYYAQHRAAPLERYLDDEGYRGLVAQMLEAKAMALSKFLLWRDDGGQYLATVHDLHLREAHRARIMFLERRLVALKAGQAAAAGGGGGGGGGGGDGPTPPTAAVRAAAVVLCQVRGLIDSSVDEENNLGEVRLVRAAAEGANLRTLQLLVDAGADVNAADRNGRTVVQWAALGGGAETVQALLDLGARIGADPLDGWAPVMSAAMRGQSAVIELMQVRNADRCAPVNTQYRTGWTALWFAAVGGQAEAVRQLRRLGADPNLCGGDGFSPLMAAALGGHVGTIDALSEVGADAKAVMVNGFNAVCLAAIGGHGPAILRLCALGADVDAAHSANGFTAVFVAALGGHVDAVRALVECKADIRRRTKRGLTPLLVAAMHGHQDLVKLLGEGQGQEDADLLSVLMKYSDQSRSNTSDIQDVTVRETCRFLHAGQDYEKLEGLEQMLAEVESSRNEIAVDAGRGLAPLLRSIVIRLKVVESVILDAEVRLIGQKAGSEMQVGMGQ